MPLVIHIGFGKTGTTAIQDFFFHHRGALAKAGFLYPEIGLRGTGHHDLAQLSAKELTPILRSHYRTIAHQLKDNPNRSVILSSEFFCFMHPNYIRQVAEIFEGEQVKILFYVRPQISLVESTYMQFQKVGKDYHGDIGRFFSFHRQAFDFFARIAPWVENFGEEAILARLFDRRIIGEDVRADITKLLGVDSIIEIGDVEKSNISLLPEYSKLVTHIDELCPSTKSRQAIMDELLSLSSRVAKTPGFSLLDDELKRGIIEHYTESNSLFAERFLDDQQAFLLLAH